MLFSVLNSFGRLIFWVAGFLCHQRPERSPHLFGAQMPLCWRCTGILAGSVALVILLIIRRRLPSLAWSVALSLLMPLDVALAVVGVWNGHNSLRLITGFLWGLFSTAAVLHLLSNEQLWISLFAKFKPPNKLRTFDVH
ncbi:MAG TPA: hypothetical protein DHU55_10865 [Blastocatellia bacterium]|jgi:uncharacterized membrane protein|nr:hypothetical protein [Blastocatellia bacterium]HAF24962.1 hypothetical protein [Blastocatellia bacterium]HCX30254.1 hypothetical protein [Blastocatellia bacterium]